MRTRRVFDIRVIILHAVDIAITVTAVIAHIVEYSVKLVLLHNAAHIVEKILVPFRRGGVAAPVAVIILHQL